MALKYRYKATATALVALRKEKAPRNSFTTQRYHLGHSCRMRQRKVPKRCIACRLFHRTTLHRMGQLSSLQSTKQLPPPLVLSSSSASTSTRPFVVLSLHLHSAMRRPQPPPPLVFSSSSASTSTRPFVVLSLHLHSAFRRPQPQPPLVLSSSSASTSTRPFVVLSLDLHSSFHRPQLARARVGLTGCSGETPSQWLTEFKAPTN